MTTTDRLLALMAALPMDQVTSAYDSRVAMESGRLDEMERLIIAQGYTELMGGEVYDGVITADGREILRALGRSWVLAHPSRTSQNVATSGPPPRNPPAHGPARGCPHCGSPLVPVANPDGLRILGCKQCRYSRIMEGLNG